MKSLHHVFIEDLDDLPGSNAIFKNSLKFRNVKMNKLATYATDGRLFTTDVSANLKVT